MPFIWCQMTTTTISPIMTKRLHLVRNIHRHRPGKKNEGSRSWPISIHSRGSKGNEEKVIMTLALGHMAVSNVPIKSCFQGLYNTRIDINPGFISSFFSHKYLSSVPFFQFFNALRTIKNIIIYSKLSLLVIISVQHILFIFCSYV